MLEYAAGDAAAFSLLFERHHRGAYRFLLRSLGGQAALADDLLQEVWIAVVRNASRWEPRARFATWLFGIARSRLIDHWRAQKDHLSLDGIRGDHTADGAANEDDPPWVEQVAASRADEPENRVLARAQARAFLAAVETLPPAQRETFLLHAEGELALDEIAHLTGVGMETAKSRLRYAMAKLRAAMEGW